MNDKKEILNFGFYHMDCMDGMKRFPDKYFDVAIVDPPYGIGITEAHKVKEGMTLVGGVADRSVAGKSILIGGGYSGKRFDNSKGGVKKFEIPSKFYKPFDDSTTPNGEYFEELFRVSKVQIIWGGNFFLDYLGKASCILVWDKGRRGMTQADCEVAWTSLKGQSRIFNFKWNGMLQEDMKNKEKRIHPTQKPVELYKWILGNFTNSDDKILDTHVGSASSLIACEEYHRKYVGFEKDEYYYNIAKERLQDETAQMTIFDLVGEPT